MGIALVNQSTKISDADVRNIAAACDAQLHGDVAKVWNIHTPLRVTTSLGAKDYPFFLVDTIPEQADALAYHFVQDNGIPAGKIGVQTTLDAGESVSSATSHEAVELQCDIYCASWSYSNRLRCLVATEACDPVQGDTYTITLANGATVEVSDFVTPAYFTDDALGRPLDHLGKLDQTFAINKGGYQIQMKAGAVANVFGDEFPERLRTAKLASHGRTFWRHVTMAIALSR